MKIGFGVFCFGDKVYYEGAYNKILNIIGSGYDCYVLTEDVNYFKDIDKLNIISYLREYKSYHDKLKLPKYILNDCDVCILIDADLNINDYSFLDDLRHYNFKDGISYIDILLNHPERKECVRELNLSSVEWKNYTDYCDLIYTDFRDIKLIWEYFLVINKNGFNDDFYLHYEKLQIEKEKCYSNNDVNAPGEGISMTISAFLSNIKIGRDIELYNKLKDNIFSVSSKFTR